MLEANTLQKQRLDSLQESADLEMKQFENRKAELQSRIDEQKKEIREKMRRIAELEAITWPSNLSGFGGFAGATGRLVLSG